MVSKLYESADADCARDLDDTRSATGYSFHLQRAGAAIRWSTKKQPTAAISTTQAEYQAMAAAVNEALHLPSFIEMGVFIDGQPSSRRTTRGASRYARIL